MAEITVAQVTDIDTGTGVFDALLASIKEHITKEYEEDRITGSDYATVYLGALQAALAESTKFVLGKQAADKQADLIAEQINSEIKNNEANGIIDHQKKKLQEEIDLVIGQTAVQYENIDASKQNTQRQNTLNSQQVIKVSKESEYIVTQNEELKLNGPVDRTLKTEQATATKSGGEDRTNEANANVALMNAQELKVESETLHDRLIAIARLEKESGYDMTHDITGTITGMTPVTTGLIDSKYRESEGRVNLIGDQRIGLKTDAKQKLLKSLFDGYSVNTSVTGEVSNAPSGATGTGIDAVANDILDDWSSTVNI